jgi:hypothetical protein
MTHTPHNNRSRTLGDLTRAERIDIGRMLLDQTDIGLIAQRYRISYATCKTLLDMHYKPPENSLPTHRNYGGPIGRCDGCGGMVILPCRICYYRAKRARKPLLTA